MSTPRLLVVAVAAYASALAFGLLVLPIGLILHEAVAWPLTLAVAATYGSLAATWATGSSARPRRVLRVALLVALALSVVFWSPLGPAIESVAQTPLNVLLAFAGAIAIGATAAAAREAQSGEPALGRVKASLVAAVAALVAVPATVLVASLFGLTGA